MTTNNSNDNNKNIDVKHLDITISENDNTECILRTVKIVRTHWDTTKIKLKLLTDGITNKLVLCTHTNEEENGHEEFLLVRIYGHKTDLLIDRKAEVRNIKLLHEHGLAPNLYATFENGLIYEFIPGNTLSPDDVVQPEMYKLVAKELAKMHKIKVPNNHNPVAGLWSKFQQFFDLIPDRFVDEQKQKRYESMNFPKCQLWKEMEELKKELTNFDMPVVFAHNDLLLGNIIYNKDKHKVFFIDFEYACFNYQAYDIGNHFAEFAGVNDLDYSKFPKKDLQLKWLKTYLMEYKNTNEVSEHEIEVLYVQVNKCVMATHLLWYAWTLIQAAHSHIDFDFIGYGILRINEYFKRKRESFSLRIPPLVE